MLIVTGTCQNLVVWGSLILVARANQQHSFFDMSAQPLIDCMLMNANDESSIHVNA